MSEPTGTVQRWDAYVQTAVAEPYVEWIKDAEGRVVTYDDHKAAMDDWERKCRDLCLAHGALLFEHDAFTKQAVALANEVLRYKQSLDNVYRHNLAARAAVIHYFGLHHNLAVIEQAQAILDAQGRKG